MKVAIVQEHVDTTRGGAETSTVEMARCLAALGVDVSLLYSNVADAAPFVRDNVTYLAIPTGKGAKPLRTYRYLQGANRLCRAEHFDVVHAVTPCLCANIYQPRGGTYPETIRRTLARYAPPGRWLRSLARRLNIRQRFLLRIERRLLTRRRTVHVAAVSDYVRRQVVNGYKVPTERCRVVYNGVDFSPLSEPDASRERRNLRTALGLTDEQPLLLFVAHNYQLKGLRELLIALMKPASAGHTLVIAGRDNPRPYRALVERTSRHTSIHFVGTKTPVRSWYAAADVLVHPTWYDPCSRVVLEALCAGLPVVTTELNGAAEVMDAARHGAIIPTPNDPDALITGINEALGPTIRANCQADAPAFCDKLSMARHARELHEFYQHALVSQSPASADRTS